MHVLPYHTCMDNRHVIQVFSELRRRLEAHPPLFVSLAKAILETLPESLPTALQSLPTPRRRPYLYAAVMS